MLENILMVFIVILGPVIILGSRPIYDALGGKSSDEGTIWEQGRRGTID